MLKLSLVNMPFASVHIPSFALTQLKAVLDECFGEKVAVDVLYLNQEFAHYFGLELYKDISESFDTGLGDWFFRQIAFPQLPDNAERYFKRYYPLDYAETQQLKAAILAKRATLGSFLDELIAKYQLDQADLVGFTSMFTQNVASLALAGRIKERKPDLITVMGGANCETPMGPALVANVKQIDYTFSGPALKSFPEFIQNLLNGEPKKNDRIKGVFSKTNCGLNQVDLASQIGEEVSVNVKVNLDYEPFLTLIEQNFKGRITPVLLFETSRGCWWGEKAHCTFCGLNGSTMSYRNMNPELAIEQFDDLFKYAPRCSRFESVDNIMPKSYPKEVFPVLNVPPEASIFYEVKADLAEDDMQVLARANVNCVQPGVESINTSTLKLMRKGTSAFQNLVLLKNCVKYDIFPTWNLLLGFPGEKEEVYKKYVADIPLLTHLPPPGGAYPVRFDRYSPYFVQAKEYGLDLHPFDYYHMIYPFKEQVLTDIAYYFVNHNLGADYITAVAKWISQVRAQVEKWQAGWFGADRTPPQLFMKQRGQSTVICDSRSGARIEYEISETTKQILDQLARAQRLAELGSHLAPLQPEELSQQVAFLRSHRLIFEEGDRMISLVLPQEPGPMRSLKTAKDFMY